MGEQLETQGDKPVVLMSPKQFMQARNDFLTQQAAERINFIKELLTKIELEINRQLSIFVQDPQLQLPISFDVLGDYNYIDQPRIRQCDPWLIEAKDLEPIKENLERLGWQVFRFEFESPDNHNDASLWLHIGTPDA